MGSLSNLYISQSFTSLLHLGNDGPVTDLAPGQYTQFQDGLGNSLGISVNSSGDISSSGYIYATNIFPTITTASFNQYTASTNIRLNNLESTTASLNSSVSNLNTATASLFTSASLALVTASFNSGTRNLTFTKGNGTTFNVNIPDVSGSTINTGSFATTGSNIFYGDQTISGSGTYGINVTNGIKGDYFYTDTQGVFTPILYGANIGYGKLQIEALDGVNINGNLTASLQQGYVWVGDSLNKSILVATSSLVTNINTGSLVTTASFNQYTQSNNQRVSSLETNSASVNISINALNIFTASQSTASIVTSITNLNNFTSSANSRLNNIETTTASLLIETQNLELFSASALVSISNLNQSSQSQQISIDALNSFSSSTNTRLTNIETTTASLNTSVSNLNSFSASQLNINSGYNSYTQSNDTKWSNLGSQSGSWITESETGSFARYNVDNPWSVTQNFTNITAVSASFQYVQTIFETASVIYSSGSNQFGDEITDIQTLIGQTKVSGSLGVTGSFYNNTLRYPIADNGAKSFIQSDGAGTLSLQYVDTIWESVRAGENVVKGTPLYISGSQGAAPIVYAADASNPAKMPVTFIAGQAYTAGTTYNAIVLGLIEGMDLTGYTAGQTVYVAEGGGWTTNLPSGSNSITQVLGVVTKGGNGGKGLVLNPGPAQLPGLQTGYVWVGNGNNRPVSVSTSSLQTDVSGYTTTASFNSYTSSTNGRLTNIESTTASLNSSISQLNQSSASQQISIDNLNTNSASVNISVSNLNTFSGSTLGRLSNLESTSASVNISIAALNSSSASQQISIDALNQFTASQSTASIVNSITNLNQFTSSANNRLNNLESTTASLLIETSNLELFSASTLTRLTNIETTTASLNSSVTQLNQFTSSQLTINTGYNSFTESANQRLSAIENVSGSWITETESGSFLITASFSGNTLTFTKGDNTTFGIVIPDVSGSTINTGSFATTGSNAFFGTNTFSGAVSFTGSAPTILSSSFSGSLITNLTDTYTDVSAVQQIVTLTSASYAGLLSGSLTNPNTLYIVSGSVGENYLNITTFNSYTSSTNSRLNNIETTTASLLIETQNLELFSASALSSISQLNQSSASQQISINALNVFTASQSTASLVTSINNLNSFTQSANVRLNNLETTTASLLIETQNLELFSASALISINALNTNSASVNNSISALNTFTASQSTASIVISIDNLNQFTSSANIRLSNLETTTASLNSSISQLNASSASQQISIDSLNQKTGSYATTGSNAFIGNQSIIGNLTISGSAQYDLTITGAIQVTNQNGIGGVTLGPTEYNLNTTKTLGAANGFIFGPTGSEAQLTIGVYDDPNFNTDVEVKINASANGVTFNDWDNGSTFSYVPWLEIEPNLGNNPAPQFKRSIAVTGSVSITDVINLKGQDPLPTGNIGDLAVSSSHLYFYNGAWTRLD